MRVVTTTLEMLQPPSVRPRPWPSGVRLDLAQAITPEYARFLYGLVGGPWYWIDRLGWLRDQWDDELSVEGTEFWVLYGQGVPLGFVQLQPQPVDGSSHVEIRYFGLAETATGQGLGGRMLEHGLAAAWSLAERNDVPPVSRVWVHTCTLDGPVALSNYQGRGLVICRTEEAEQEVPAQPLGAWASTGGPAEIAGLAKAAGVR